MNILTKLASLLMISAGLIAAPLASAAPHDHKPAQTKHVKKPAKKAVKHKKAVKPKKAAKVKKAAPKKVAKKNAKQVKRTRHHAQR